MVQCTTITWYRGIVHKSNIHTQSESERTKPSGVEWSYLERRKSALEVTPSHSTWLKDQSTSHSILHHCTPLHSNMAQVPPYFSSKLNFIINFSFSYNYPYYVHVSSVLAVQSGFSLHFTYKCSYHQGGDNNTEQGHG